MRYVSDFIGAVKARQTEIAESVIAGNCMTYEAYQRLVGINAGLEEALEILNNLLKEEEKDVALERITTKLVPGLWEYGRTMTKKESAATMIVELSLEKISAKARSGDPSDDEEDLDLPLWAGIIPLTTVQGSAITAKNAAGIAVPPHIK